MATIVAILLMAVAVVVLTVCIRSVLAVRRDENEREMQLRQWLDDCDDGSA